MSTPYTAVNVEGALLSGDLIQRIAAGDRSLPGFRPEDYHLAAGERLGDAASRRWEYLVGAYRAFRDRLDRLPDTDPATSETRERWLLLLLDELGFGRVPFVRGGLDVGGKSFPVSHRWQHVPIHLVGWHTRLDHRSGGGETGRAPQSMLQELLNVSDDHLWGVLSNGRMLRILRDSSALVGSAYVEFDLEAIFDGDLYSDFLLLLALLHVSRLELLAVDEGEPTPADCWLERWRSHAIETGERVREQLRGGVEKAINELGTGFLAANPALRDALSSGALRLGDFHHELLRLAYQLIFLFVAEDRGALHGPGVSAEAHDRYARYFSTARLRRIAGKRRGDRHTDLWCTLVIVLDALGSDDGAASLGLPGLGGLYFRAGTANGDSETAPDLLRDCELANSALLSAVRSLSEFHDTRGRLQRVDYQHLGADELGSVYESLLELVPRRPSADEFLLEPLPGNDRKTTGSYYTPSSLVELLLDSALDPVIDEHAASGAPADLLKITVCDPASGSGHFLVAAARRIAKRYAAMQTGEDEPTPEAVRSAMHLVVERCIYGVDVNPLAAELAKVSLWLESLEPGKPLAFLDHRIKVGNSLLGVTPRLLEGGIPDEAYRPIEGDDKRVAASLRKHNAKERHGQDMLFAEPVVRVGNVEQAEQVGKLAVASAASLADVREQARRFRELENSPDVRRRKTVADAWCAAFVWRKHADAPEAITSDTLRRLDAGLALPEEVAAELARLSNQYRFFHWHLEFPEVFRVEDEEDPDHSAEAGWEGGFSCVLGNPPWEHIELKEQEFFGQHAPEIARATGAHRKRLIAGLATSEDTRPVYEAYLAEKRRIDGIRHLVATSGLYPLTGRGRVNTYAAFAERDRSQLHPRGRLGVIVPTGIATDATTQYFFRDLVERSSLVSLYDFENARGIFPAVHRSYKLPTDRVRRAGQGRPHRFRVLPS